MSLIECFICGGTGKYEYSGVLMSSDPPCAYNFIAKCCRCEGKGIIDYDPPCSLCFGNGEYVKIINDERMITACEICKRDIKKP